MIDQVEADERERALARFAEREAARRRNSPYLASLRAVRQCISDLKENRESDPHIIMKALPHLHMDDGWKLAISVNGDRYFSFSVFYASPAQILNTVGSEPSDSAKAQSAELEDIGLVGILPDVKTNLFKHVHLDGTKESFWEAVLLDFVSSQYHLGWHANYKRKRIVTSVETFSDEIGPMFEINKDEVNGLLQKWAGEDNTIWRNSRLLPEVILKLKGNYACVSYGYFSPFAGLCLMRACCTREPFAIVESQRRGGFSYDCGITY